MRRSFTAAIVVVAITAVIAPMPGQAQSDYPNRVVKIVVPYAAGTVPDILVRGLTPGLSGRLGQQFIVENKAGGSGALGTASVARAEADGYTLLFAPAVVLSVLPQARNAMPATSPTPSLPICQTFVNTMGLTCARTCRSGPSPTSWLQQSKSPERLNYGHPGVITIPQLAVEEFLQAAGIDIKDIPFRTGPQRHRAARRTARCGFEVMGTEVGQNIRVIGVFARSASPIFPMCRPSRSKATTSVPASFGGLLAPLGNAGTDHVQAVVGLRRSRKGRLYATIAKRAGQPDDYYDDAAAFRRAPRARHRHQGARAVASQDTIKEPRRKAGVLNTTLLTRDLPPPAAAAAHTAGCTAAPAARAHQSAAAPAPEDLSPLRWCSDP